MKWPASITLIRHGQSAYNELRLRKQNDPEYQEFLKLFKSNPHSIRTQLAAQDIQKKFALNVSDYETPLSEVGWKQGRATGAKLLSVVPPADIILVSPYFRARDTFTAMIAGGSDPGNARVIVEDRIREQEHGLSLLYNDWRVFHVMHPEQKMLYELLGPYWYQYPQGESVSQVRERIRSVTNTMIREYAGLHVRLVTHHLTILSVRANYERISPEEFMRLDAEEKPINCGVTIYRCDPSQGSQGRLVLEQYNTRLY